MGGYWSSKDSESPVVAVAPSTPQKRKHEPEEVDAEECCERNTPRKKMRTTSEYIYKTLYVNGENSDIKIKALDVTWKLHKIYLCQSAYFRSMIKGEWVEKEQEEVCIHIPDDLINTKALDIAFGSLYSYEVDVELLTKNLIPVLAASRMFQLDGLLQHCEDTMLETICAEYVCQYYDASTRYGLVLVKERCFSWLERNLLLCRTSALAKYLSEELLKLLLMSKHFVVMQVEMDIYNFLKIWLYLQLHPTCELPLKKLVGETQKFFHEQKNKNHTEFLSCPMGSKFVDVFKCLRVQNMVGDIKCIKLLEKDFIIPKDWLLPLYEWQWQKMLSVYSGEDNGPADISEEFFEENSCRCGRILESDTRYCWRWTGFSYGIDMIVTYNNRTRTLSVKRNTFSQPCNFAVCLQSTRSVALRFKAFTLADSGQEALCKDTGVMTWTFQTDEEIPVIVFDDTWNFPVYISARLLLATRPE